MNVIWLLLKASWLNVAIAVLTGLVSGGCSAQLIALINRAISGNSTNNWNHHTVSRAAKTSRPVTAYLENRPIYLFDEWASDQDPFFRDIFYKQLLADLMQRGKTVLVISHDDRYFHLADQLIKLDYGKVEYDRHK